MSPFSDFRWQASRRQSHTPEFRAEERTFEHFAAADQYLKLLSAGKV